MNIKVKTIIVCVILLLVLIVGGCKHTKTTDKDNDVITTQKSDDASTMTKDQIVKRLNSVNSHITDLWNNVFCEVKWYSDEGLSAIGETLDIDFVVENMDKYYNKVRNDKPFINSLSSEYYDIKNAFDKMLDKATIIYNNIKNETPKPKKELNYKADIELFNQYQQFLWETIVDLVNEQFYND